MNISLSYLNLVFAMNRVIRGEWFNLCCSCRVWIRCFKHFLGQDFLRWWVHPLLSPCQYCQSSMITMTGASHLSMMYGKFKWDAIEMKKKKKNLMHATFICEIHRFIPFPHKRPCMMMFRISNNLQLIKTLVLPWRVHNYLKLLCDYQLITLPLSSLLIALMLWLLLAEVSPHNQNYSRITYSFFIYQHRAWI